MHKLYSKSKELFWGVLLKIHPKLHAAVFKYRIIIRYLISGGSAAFTNLALLALLVELLKIHYIPASIVSFILAFIVSFTMMKFFTFGDRGLSMAHHQLLVYLSIALGNLLLNTLLLFIFVEFAGIWYLLSQAFASIIIAISSFFLYRLFVFLPPGKEPPVGRVTLAACAGLFVIVVTVYVPLFLYSQDLAELQASRGVVLTLPVYGSDSEGYIGLSEGLLNNHFFGHYPDIHDTFRTPGYPMLLAAWKGTFGSYDYFPVLQIALAYLTALFLFFTGRRLFSTIVGFLAGALFLLDPNTIYHSLVLLTEIPHVFLMAAALFFAIVPHKRLPLPPAFWSALCLGLAALIRPVSMYLPILFALYFAYAAYREHKTMWLRRAAIQVVILALVFGAVLMPWLLRNYRVSGALGVSSVPAFNLIQYIVPDFLSYVRHTSADVERARLQKEVPIPTSHYVDLAYTKTISSISVSYIKEYPMQFLKFALIKDIPFFFASSAEIALASYNDLVGVEVFPPKTSNLTNAILAGDFKVVSADLRLHPFSTTEQIVLGLMMLFAVLALLEKKHRVEILFLGLFFLYFAAVSTIVSNARLRVPSLPALDLLVAVGLLATMKLFKRNQAV